VLKTKPSTKESDTSSIEVPQEPISEATAPLPALAEEDDELTPAQIEQSELRKVIKLAQRKTQMKFGSWWFLFMLSVFASHTLEKVTASIIIVTTFVRFFDQSLQSEMLQLKMPWSRR
jgi:hypothetical protein